MTFIQVVGLICIIAFVSLLIVGAFYTFYYLVKGFVKEVEDRTNKIGKD